MADSTFDISDLPAPPQNSSVDISDLPAPAVTSAAAPDRRRGTISGAMRRMQEPGFVPPAMPKPLSASELGREYAQFGKGAAIGVPSGIIGLPGAVESLGRAVLPVSNQTFFPTPERVGEVIAGKPVSSAEKTGRFIGEFASPGTVVKAAKPIVSGVGKAVNVARTATGKPAKNLSEALRTEIGGKTEDVIRAAKEAQVEPAKKLEAVGKAQQQLGGREPVATARQVARERDAEKSLSSLSGKTNVLAEDVGAIIQPEAKRNIEALKKERQKEAITELKDPAFSDARSRETRGDFIATNKESAQKYDQVMQEINQQISRTPEPYGSELRKRLSSISGREVPLSEAETRAAQVRSSITGEPVPTMKTEPLTLDQAEFMRRLLKSRDLKEGFPALDTTRMQQLGDKLGEAMIAYEPRIGSYIEKYREKSVPITRALAGRGRALTDVELKEAENLLFAADKQAAARYYLDGSQERAQALLAVSGGKKPEIVDTIKGYFRSELQGMNARQAESFLQKQEGFLREFPELRKPLKDIVDTKRIAETAGVSAEKRAGAAATRLSGEAKTAESTLTPQAKIEDKYSQLQNALETSEIKDTSKNAKTIADNMRSDGLIDDAAHKKLLVQIQMIKNAYGETAEARKAVLAVLGTLGVGFAGRRLVESFTGK